MGADPHENANVLGAQGIEGLAEATAPLPFTFRVYASGCVPAPPFENDARASTGTTCAT